MREFDWSELIIFLAAVIILIKILRDRYNEIYGGKK
jgi:hypothetical protein